MSGQSFAQTFQIIHLCGLFTRENERQAATSSPFPKPLSLLSVFCMSTMWKAGGYLSMHASSPFFHPILAAAADQKSYFRMMDEIVMQIGRKRASERT